MNLYNDHARFDASNKIHSTAIIHDCVEMGKNNIIGAYSVIGGDGEIRGVETFEGRVVIGDGNKISELVTIQRPQASGAVTIIGHNNIIMAHSHIGHDAVIGNGCELSSGCIIGGYAQIKGGAKIKLGVVVRNRKIVGYNAICGMGAVVVKDVENGVTVIGNPAKHYLESL